MRNLLFLWHTKGYCELLLHNDIKGNLVQKKDIKKKGNLLVVFYSSDHLKKNVFMWSGLQNTFLSVTYSSRYCWLCKSCIVCCLMYACTEKAHNFRKKLLYECVDLLEYLHFIYLYRINKRWIKILYSVRCSFVPELDLLVSMATFPIGKQITGRIFKNCSCNKSRKDDLRRPPLFFIFHNPKNWLHGLSFFQ